MTILHVKKLFKGENGYTSENVPCQCPVLQSPDNVHCVIIKGDIKKPLQDDPTIVRILFPFPFIPFLWVAIRILLCSLFLVHILFSILPSLYLPSPKRLKVLSSEMDPAEIRLIRKAFFKGIVASGF
jgi:hypothetical protein